jgi:hypothetical protein
MLELQFIGINPIHRASIGPVASFRVAGNFIRNADTSEILARYLNHFWHVEAMFFTRYDCSGPVFMHFEDLEGGETPRYGPFDHLSVADGSVHHDDKLVAKFIDPTLLWHDIESDTYWQNLILSCK